MNYSLIEFNHSLQVKPPCSLTPQETEYLTNRIQNGGTEVVEVMQLRSFFLFSALEVGN